MAVYTSNTSNGYQLRLTVNQQTHSASDITNNRSQITWSLRLYSGNVSCAYNSQSIKAVINGSTVYNASRNITIGFNTNILLAEGTLSNVAHNTDGSKTVACSFEWAKTNTSSVLPSATLSGSGNLTLTTIPRASTASLSANTVDYGNALTVNIARASTSFTHDVTVKSAQGNLLSYTNVATSQAFTIPGSWLASFTSGSSTTGTVTVQTKNGSANVGSSVSINFTINVPRGNSSIGASSVAYGANIAINVSKVHSTLSHYIIVSLPGRSTTYTITGTTTSQNIPLEWLNGFTTGVTASGSISVQTRNGNTNIGSAMTHNFSATVPSNIVPSVSISRTSFSSGLSGFNEPIQGISQMTLTRTAGGSYSSSISKTEWSMSAGGGTGTAATISFTAAVANPQYIYCKVTDSRGRTAQGTYTSWNHSYSNPNISNLEFYRCNSNGLATQDGTYIMFKPTFSFTSLSNINQLTRREQINCSPAYDFSAITPTSISGAWLGPTGSGRLTITNSFTFVFTITDSIGNSAKRTVTIPVSEVLMNFPSSADAIAIGQYSTKSKTFQVGWDAEFNGNIIGSLNIPQSLSQSPTRNGSGLKVNNQPIPMTVGYNLSKDLVVGKPGLSSSWGHASIKGNPTAGGADIGLVDPGTEAPLSNQKINMVYSGLGLDSVVNFAIDGEFYFNEALDKAIGCTVITTAAGVAYRFTNGLMICIANRSFTSIVYSAVSGGYEAPYQVWSFPHAFNSVPAVIVNGDVGSTGWYESFWSDTQDGAKVHYGWTCKSNSAPPSSNITKLQLVAIGNWKTPNF